MGASSWDYWVPYQEDFNQALQELRQREFESFKPYRLDERWSPWRQTEEEAFLHAYSEYNSLDEVPDEDLVHFRRMKSMKEPANIDDLIEWTAPDGTSTIMDIEKVADTPDFGVATPVSKAGLMELFGTYKPTRSMIEDRIDDLINMRRSWQATIVIAYKDDVPDEILFAGYSGD